MKGIVRVGDKLSRGGQVRSGSTRMKFEGVGVARLNDPVSCRIVGHSPSYISEGHPTLTDNGIPVAFDGYECSCGCTLISSLSHAKTSK